MLSQHRCENLEDLTNTETSLEMHTLIKSRIDENSAHYEFASLGLFDQGDLRVSSRLELL